MALEIVRRIRGNVHGSVDVSALEDKVIAHPLFQRLRRIRQTAFLSFVFPGATHTRFEHSLGVMHLAGVAWNALYANQKRLAVNTSRYSDFASREMKTGVSGAHGLLNPTFEMMERIFSSDYSFQTLRLAALMHDLGHPPFSHSGERFLPSLKEVIDQNKDLPDYLKDFLEAKAEEWLSVGKDPAKTSVRHEIFTLLLVDRLLNDIYKNHQHLSLQIPAQDVLSVITPELSPTRGSELHAYEVYKFCHELVSGEFDIDRMDYLQRDSKECGVVYGIFDSDRILDSLCFYFDPSEKRLHLAIQYSGLAAFEDYLRARQSMYIQLYFHKTSVAAEAMMQYLAKKLGGWRLPGHWKDYAAIDEFSIGSHLEQAAEEVLSDEQDRQNFNQVMRDVLYDRRLWKRVFELTGSSNAIRLSPEIELAKKEIEQLGLTYEQISSSSYLTRFLPRQGDEASKNYLRLIKKDAVQFPRVEPLEDYTNLFAGQNMVHITRLYVEARSKSESDQTLHIKAKQRITEVLQK